MSKNVAGFTFLRWNGKYGNNAKFVVQDNQSGKQSMFSPGRTQDLCWTSMDLATTPEISSWQDFGNEIVDSLEDVAF